MKRVRDGARLDGEAVGLKSVGWGCDQGAGVQRRVPVRRGGFRQGAEADLVSVERGAGAYADVRGVCGGGSAAEQSACERELSRSVADAGRADLGELQLRRQRALRKKNQQVPRW